MTFKDALLQTPLLEDGVNYKELLKECHGLYMIPTRRKHKYSGYNCMVYVIQYKDRNGIEQMARIDNGSDVVWGVDEVGNKGQSFSIDCDQGVMHLYHYGKSFRVVYIGSDLKICPN